MGWALILGEETTEDGWLLARESFAGQSLVFVEEHLQSAC